MISENLHRVQAQLADACARYGRNPQSVKLIAVSKTKPSSDVRAAFDAGQRDFGENYVQELIEKMNDAELSALPMAWHFIGHLQSNKAKYLVEKVALIHAIDSGETAKEISKRAQKIGRIVPILLEVNISAEMSKHGLSPESLFFEAEKMFALPNVEIKGLMTIASPDTEKVKQEFKAMNRLFEKLKTLAPTPEAISELSMGMSGDFEIAIGEGATLIRIGTAIFGAR